MNDKYFIRDELLSPRSFSTKKRWFSTLYQSLFSSFGNTLITLLCVILLFVLIKYAFSWLIVNAAWTGYGREMCATVDQGGYQDNGWSGACWSFVVNNFSTFLYGDYPSGETWRLNLLCIFGLILIVPLLILRLPFKILNAILVLFILPFMGFFLIQGGWFGLSYVSVDLFGGLALTFVIAFMGVVFSLPLGSVLALMRLSKRKFLSRLATFIIEVIRSFPLIAILFGVIFLLPLLFPGVFVSGKFSRALIAIILFSSAYMAEVIRGGITSVPHQQYEASKALGLNAFWTYVLIILPQGLRASLPAIVNTVIGIFKDTSLVYVVSMFDFIGIVRRVVLLPEWLTPVTPITGLVFLGLVFWVLCFLMSTYAKYLERNLK